MDNICDTCKHCWNYQVCENGCYGSQIPCNCYIDERETKADCQKVQEALQLSFTECCSLFTFDRQASWWSIVGETKEERQRNGQKVTTTFIKKG